jgi:hypothetical protein
VAGLGEQQRVLHNLADGDSFVFGQRILGTDHQQQLVTENGLNLQAGRLNRQGENAHFNHAVLEFLHDLVTEVAVDTDLDRRIAAAILGEDFRQNVQASRLVRSHPQRTARGAAVIGHSHQRFVAQAFEPLGVFVEHLAGRSQLNGLARAVEKAIAIFLLQLPNLRADGRLRPEHLLSGTGKAALPGNFQKCNELIEVHFGCERNYSGVCCIRG